MASNSCLSIFYASSKWKMHWNLCINSRSCPFSTAIVCHVILSILGREKLAVNRARSVISNRSFSIWNYHVQERYERIIFSRSIWFSHLQQRKFKSFSIGFWSNFRVFCHFPCIFFWFSSASACAFEQYHKLETLLDICANVWDESEHCRWTNSSRMRHNRSIWLDLCGQITALCIIIHKHTLESIWCALILGKIVRLPHFGLKTDALKWMEMICRSAGMRRLEIYRMENSNGIWNI